MTNTVEKQSNEADNDSRNTFAIESEFNHHYFNAEGSSGLLFKAAEDDKFDDISRDVLLSANYSTHTAIFEMKKLFQDLLNNYTELEMKYNKTLVLDPIKHKKQLDIESEFNEHLSAVSFLSRLLFAASDEGNGIERIGNDGLEAGAYNLEEAASKMKEAFYKLLNSKTTNT